MLRSLRFRLSTKEASSLSNGNINLLITFIVATIFAAVYGWHFITLQKYLVNIPYWDEWGVLDTPGALQDGGSISWIFALHNEHRIATTKILICLLYKLDGWNLIVHQKLNYFLYGVLLLLIILFACKIIPHLRIWITISFLIFLLSPINSENHIMGFQSQMHFSLFFFLTSVYFLYSDPQTWARSILGSLMAMLSIYSLSSGVVSCIIVLMIFSIFKIRRWYMKTDNRELQQLIAVTLLIGGAIVYWFMDFHSNAAHPIFALPHEKIFWAYYANLIGHSFGIDLRTFVPNFFCLLIVITPIILNLRKKRLDIPSSSWAVYTVILGTLAALASISIGRGNWGAGNSKTSRYTEIGMLLIPFSVFAWSIYLENQPKVKTYVISLLWVFCFLSFYNNWSTQDYYWSAVHRGNGIRCVRDYYMQGGDANCPTLYPVSLADNLERAKKLNLSFYREISSDVGTLSE
jgi:hypothetical protein